MVDEANIEAEYKDGVLTLLLPKKESAKTVRQIEIK
jgi:HSP20 family molecular chaperone IbpA